MRRPDNYHIAFFLALLIFAVIVLVQLYRSEDEETDAPEADIGELLEEQPPVTPLPPPEDPPEIVPGTTASGAGTPLKPAVPNAAPVPAAAGSAEPDTETASETSRPSPAPSDTLPERTHVVQRGETLWSIAEEYYGSGPMYRKIVEANPGIDPHNIKPGRVLVVPEE